MKIYIWGTGRLVGLVVGRYVQIEEIEGFIDNDTTRHQYMNRPVFEPADMLCREYDAILVANLYAEQICEQCREIGIDLSKLIFLYENYRLEDMNTDYQFVENVLGHDIAKLVKNQHYVVRGVEAYGDLCFRGSQFEDQERIKGQGGEGDYVRLKCFELAVKEIRKRKVPGQVAELGVFRGEFAQYINFAFPDRKCYLFDTFGGFDANEALREVRNGNCTEAFAEAFKRTDLKIVLDRMTYLDNIVIKQGFFPDSLDGLEEQFAFVSLDVDFEDSIYEGLKYFYPRLSNGGYIFIHDYNGTLSGVEKAVDRFEEDNKICLNKVPLCDRGGTLVVT